MSASVPPTISAIWATVRSIIAVPRGPRSARAPAPPGRRTGGSRRPPRCPVSWPLPAISTTSPGPAQATACRIASRRSPISTTCALPPAGAPARISRRIAAGSSPRGLSSVTTTRSASSAATSPIGARLPGSRSPPAPNTTASRRPGCAQGGQHRPQRARLVGVVDQREEILAAVDLFQPPGNPGFAAAPAMPAPARPRPHPESPARQGNWRRCSGPAAGCRRGACTPAGSTTVNSCPPAPIGATSTARQSAGWPVGADGDRVTGPGGHRAPGVVVDAHHGRAGAQRRIRVEQRALASK